MDLHRIIVNAQAWGGGKPVIIAAYIPADRVINWRLANAMIFASGGYHIETGEPHAMLSHAYFPSYTTIPAADEAVLSRYYDFLVRYENVLSLGTRAASSERIRTIEVDDLRMQGIRAKDRVVPVVRVGDDYEAINLINFVGIDASDWNQPTTVPPTALDNVEVRIAVTRDVEHVWAASPDEIGTMGATALPFTVEAGVLSVALPHLHYWGMLVLEYAYEN
jgi:dextranase